MDVELEGEGSVTLFRSAKRRKFQSARRPTEDLETRAELGSPDSDSAAIDRSGDEPALREILKQRRTTRNRRQGIEFSTMKTNAEMESPMSKFLTTEPHVDQMKAISDRFVGHTGQVVDVDKHMFVLYSALLLISVTHTHTHTHTN
jgi:hypothetical protein